MLAIETNVVVRYLTGDHPEQADAARRLIDGGEVYVPVTVLLETEWVPRSAYGFPAEHIAWGLRAFGGLPNVTLEDGAATHTALSYMEGGMDFADALHLAKSQGCKAFLTFDRALAKLAEQLSDIAVRAP